MMKPIFLSVFFPVFNERENLRLTIERTLETLEASPFIAGYEIIIVDDGSHDGSRYIAEGLSKKHSSVRVIRHAENRGYGEALKTGIAAARMEYVFFTEVGKMLGGWNGQLQKQNSPTDAGEKRR